MTVSYAHKVSQCHGFGTFWKLLFRWKASVYKLVWRDMTAYTVIYTTLSIIYRFALSEQGKRTFEKISKYCKDFSVLMPIAFVMGFYLKLVVSRWWAQAEIIPLPYNLAFLTAISLIGQDSRAEWMRLTIMRYVNLSIALTYAIVSPDVCKRFATLENIMEEGLMTAEEKVLFENMGTHPHQLYWLPFIWAGRVVARATKEGRIKDAFSHKMMLEELDILRFRCSKMLMYVNINIPLAYTQVVTLVVYLFFISSIMGTQFHELPKGEKTFNMYVPMFTSLQFFFYMGWLKVAESLFNPFGEDDDDFDLNRFLNGHIKVTKLMTKKMHEEYPEVLQDVYWGDPTSQDRPSSAVLFPLALLPKSEHSSGSSSVTRASVRSKATTPEREDTHGNAASVVGVCLRGAGVDATNGLEFSNLRFSQPQLCLKSSQRLDVKKFE